MLNEWGQSVMGMGFINLSGTCATTKLIQCRGWGISMCEVSRKFDRDPEDAPDLTTADFFARKRVVQAVEEWCGEDREKKFAPILYEWEIARSAAKRLRDYGHLVFTDMWLSRFLLVMCFGPRKTICGHQSFEEDYATLTKANADRFMSLVKYLSYGISGKEPAWVRATFTINGGPLHRDFLNLEKTTFRPSVPIFHVTVNDFVPSILTHEMDRIDSLIKTSSWTKMPPPEYKELVMGKKSDRPVTETWRCANEKVGYSCGNCGKLGDKMPTCSRCKLVRYCNQQCQKDDWRLHRNTCRVAAPLNFVEAFERSLGTEPRPPKTPPVSAFRLEDLVSVANDERTPNKGPSGSLEDLD